MSTKSVTTSISQVPLAGMFAIVRNQRGVIAAVEPSLDVKRGPPHLVHVELRANSAACRLVPRAVRRRYGSLDGRIQLLYGVMNSALPGGDD
ncbi:MAG: hypothetical protein ACRD2X_00405 [Vicinamibacteraceae bacterium]